MITKMMTFKNKFKIESRTLKDQEEIWFQESREDLIKISIKKFFKTLSSTKSFHKIITKEFYSLVIDYHVVLKR